MSPDEAMSHYARGDRQAFLWIYDAVAPRLERYVRRHVRDQADLEDIVQQTFLLIHDKRGTFREGARILPWAFAIARNFMVDVRKKCGREIPSDLPTECATMDAFLVQAMADGEQALETRRLGEVLVAAFGTCTDHQRNAFELTRIDGLSQSDAAEILGTTVMGIKQCTHKVYEKLRSALATLERPSPMAGAGARARLASGAEAVPQRT